MDTGSSIWQPSIPAPPGLPRATRRRCSIWPTSRSSSTPSPADLRALRAMIAESADLRRLMRSPVLSRADQGKAMAAVLEQRRASATWCGNFVGLVAAEPPPVRAAGDDRGLSGAARRAPRRGHRAGDLGAAADERADAQARRRGAAARRRRQGRGRRQGRCRACSAA